MSQNLPHAYYGPIRLAIGAGLFAFAVFYGFKCVENGRARIPATGELMGAKAKKEKLGNDFTAFYSAGEQALKGQDIYDWQSTTVAHRPFEYPPLFAVFPMMLLAKFKFNTALALFYVLNALLFAASMWMLRQLLWPPLSTYAAASSDNLEPGTWNLKPWLYLPLTGFLFTLALTWRFIHSNTNESNANMWMLFLLTLALYLDRRWLTAETASPRGGILCGIAVAMATAIKLTPGVFGVSFVWRWRPWSMLGGALGLALFLLIVPGLFLGWQQNGKYLDAYTTFALNKATGSESDSATGSAVRSAIKLITGYERATDPNPSHVGRPHQLDPNEGDSAEGVGCSMKGILTSLLTPSPALRKSKNGDAPRTVNIATLETKQVGRISNTLSLLLLLATIFFTFRARNREDVHAAALSWSLVTVTMTLISPLTRIAHLVVLAIPIATLVSMLQQKMLSSVAKKLTWAAFALIAISPATPEYFHAIGVTTFAMLVLYAALASALVPQASRLHAPR